MNTGKMSRELKLFSANHVIAIERNRCVEKLPSMHRGQKVNGNFNVCMCLHYFVVPFDVSTLSSQLNI